MSINNKDMKSSLKEERMQRAKVPKLQLEMFNEIFNGSFTGDV